jgi:hypothetical protein
VEASRRLFQYREATIALLNVLQSYIKRSFSKSTCAPVKMRDFLKFKTVKYLYMTFEKFSTAKNYSYFSVPVSVHAD